ncbi:methionine ABC transporter ATP-binding protein [Leucobacter sp. UCD-THU]|jgi:D-methionine transport system permease protein|uniref:ABC transporter permease n=1 Tax=Leucobacter muris TaxID=1935379 RepID=A0ABX5QFR5_9MICO|nr:MULTISPECIES: methionine ABC transporter permease [Leucobacter]EYT52536.1 methionine ABC transporter ATP-binding protein [Leucobacter sp. UCD-THU]QAB17806.1 ABC transporter permease [Leucobacter muris]
MDKLMELLANGKFLEATVETLVYVVFAMGIGGVLGLIIGVLLTVSRQGGILQNRALYWTLNFLVNFFRPIPFVILIAAIQPLARLVVGTGIGDRALIFVLVFAATFGIARLVEQNLLTVPPGVIEASRAMGAGPLRTILTVLIPEGLGPVVLGYTFAFIAVVDMTAMAGVIGGGGLGNLALQYGYRQFNPWVTWSAVLIIIAIVQLVQLLGNVFARKLLRR